MYFLIVLSQSASCFPHYSDRRASCTGQTTPSSKGVGNWKTQSPRSKIWCLISHRLRLRMFYPFNNCVLSIYTWNRNLTILPIVRHDLSHQNIRNYFNRYRILFKPLYFKVVSDWTCKINSLYMHLYTMKIHLYLPHFIIAYVMKI